MQLDTDQEKRLARVADQFDLDLIIAFGSTARGTAHVQSDRDLAVRLRGGNDFETGRYAELEHALHKIFPERPLDLTLINRADPLLLHEIVERGELLHGRSEDLAELRIYAYKRFQDHRRFLRMEREFVDRFLAARRSK